MITTYLLSYYNYWMVVVLMMTGLYVVITHDNLIKKLIGLNLFQASIYILFISLGNQSGGTAPILSPAYSVYSSPLPHVLILTAIVVGVAITALGLAMVIRIHKSFGVMEESRIDELSKQEEA